MFTRNLLGSRRGRLATFGILYISEGIPLGFAAVAMAAYMRRQGLDVGQIGAFVGSFYLPWAFKWSWAPLVDLVTLERFGGRKAWIAACQLLMIVTLLGVAQVDYVRHFQWLITLVLVHNVFAATQDVAIDALAVRTLAEDERATANGFMFGGANIGQGLGGGGAMFVSQHWGFDVSFIYVSMMLVSILAFVLLFVRDPTLAGGAARSAARRAAGVWAALAGQIRGFVRELRDGFFRSGIGPLAGVVFALLPMGAMALGGSVSSTLQVDLGMSDAQIAQLNIYSTILGAVGCVVGGWVSDRLGQRRMLAVWYLLTVLPSLYIAVALWSGGGLAGITIRQFFVASLVFSLCFGTQYGTSAGLFMGLTNPLVAATQFTGYMALRNLTISYTNLWQGAVADSHGYAVVFVVDAALVVLPLLVIPLLRAPSRNRQVPPSVGAPLPEAG